MKKEKTQKEIAKELGISRSYVSRIEKKLFPNCSSTSIVSNKANTLSKKKEIAEHMKEDGEVP